MRSVGDADVRPRFPHLSDSSRAPLATASSLSPPPFKHNVCLLSQSLDLRRAWAYEFLEPVGVSFVWALKLEG